jgi:cation diffusion facilitator CzcD-associated flavoprotein CzcO
LTLDRNLEVENLVTGETFEDDADIVVTARGTLNEPKYPKLPGMNNFAGETMHSATWNDR